MPVGLMVGKCSLVGNYRENNEDAVDVHEYQEVMTCVVADGMGGQAAGEKASQMATEIIPAELNQRLPQRRSADDIRRAIRRAVVQANEEIIALGQLDREYKNLGTTVVLAVWCPDFKDDCLFVAGVGDSRVYLARSGTIEQLTVDHSLAQALVEAKTISAEEAREHRFKNVLWKYLGSKEVGDGPDVKVLPVKPGDVLLLCTDGVSGAVPDDQLLAILSQRLEPQACSEALCQAALELGSKDNVSAVVIEVLDARGGK
jgi:protein phosphatase